MTTTQLMELSDIDLIKDTLNLKSSGKGMKRQLGKTLMDLPKILPKKLRNTSLDM
jgi:hypothetical protein